MPVPFSYYIKALPSRLFRWLFSWLFRWLFISCVVLSCLFYCVFDSVFYMIPIAYFLMIRFRNKLQQLFVYTGAFSDIVSGYALDGVFYIVCIETTRIGKVMHERKRLFYLFYSVIQRYARSRQYADKVRDVRIVIPCEAGSYRVLSVSFYGTDSYVSP